MDKKTLLYIANILRRGTVTWPGRSRMFDRHSKVVKEGTTKKGKPKLKKYWQCVKCKDWFRNKSALEADHIIEVGPIGEDLHDFAKRLYDESNLQPLCCECHLRKTVSFVKGLRRKNKRRGSSL